MKYDFFMYPIRWNVDKLNGYECKDHPRVMGTCYDEVWRLVGTSGCSKDANMYQWSVMGVIATNQGKLLVNPGDWVIEVTPDHYLVLDDAEYREHYLG